MQEPRITPPSGPLSRGGSTSEDAVQIPVQINGREMTDRYNEPLNPEINPMEGVDNFSLEDLLPNPKYIELWRKKDVPELRVKEIRLELVFEGELNENAENEVGESLLQKLLRKYTIPIDSIKEGGFLNRENKTYKAAMDYLSYTIWLSSSEKSVKTEAGIEKKRINRLTLNASAPFRPTSNIRWLKTMVRIAAEYTDAYEEAKAARDEENARKTAEEQKAKRARDAKTWDLEERTDRPSVVRTPNHAHPINVRLGDYEIKTWEIEEDITSYYHLRGKLSIYKIGKKTETRKQYWLFGNDVIIKKESIEWQSVVSASSSDHQLYHPKGLAELVVADLKHKGISVNPQRVEDLLEEALKPYVHRAFHFCFDTKTCANLGVMPLK